MSTKTVVQVDIYSDVICPWCLIGNHRLEQALLLTPELEAAVSWLPFELNPDMPEDGMDRQAYLEGKFGKTRAKEIYGHIAKVLDQEGLNADTSRIKRTPNTFKAHRLLYLARMAHQDGKQAHQFKLALFDAYFRNGEDIGQDAVLIRCGETAGLAKAQLQAWLTSSDGTQETRALEARAHQLGVSGVPFFILNNKYAVSGAQPPETLAEALQAAAG